MFPGFPQGGLPGEDILFSWYTIGVAVAFGVVFGFRNYMRGPQCTSPDGFPKKTVIITGANSGVGLETARELALRGAQVILACRDVEKGKKALEEVIEYSKSETAECLQLDLSSFQSIREFVKTFKSKHKTLDVLINNAGVMYSQERLSADGHEYHFAVNYLGHFLLTHLLLDYLKDGEGGRVLNLTCPAYQLGEIDIEDLNFEKKEFTLASAFSQSKLAVMLFTKELAKYCEGVPFSTFSANKLKVTANVVHPGVCYTNMYRNMPFMQSAIISYTFTPVMWFLMKGSRDGAQTTLQCILAKEEAEVSGKYYKDCRIQEPDENVNNPELSSQLWKLSAELTGITIEDASL